MCLLLDNDKIILGEIDLQGLIFFFFGLLLIIFVVGLIFFGACIFCFRFKIYKKNFMAFNMRKILELQFFFFFLTNN